MYRHERYLAEKSEGVERLGEDAWEMEHGSSITGFMDQLRRLMFLQAEIW